MRQAIIRLLDLLGESDFAPERRIVGELIRASRLRLTSTSYARSRAASAPASSRRSAPPTWPRAASRSSGRKATPDVSPFLGYRRVGENNTILFGISIPLPVNDRNQGGIARAIADEKVAETEAAQHRNESWRRSSPPGTRGRPRAARWRRFERELLPQAEESLAIALAAYREGAIGLVEYLEAQRTLADVRHEYARSLFDAQASRLMLERAVGRELPR